MHIPPFKLERYFARYEFSARYMLSSSDCESLSIGELLDTEALEGLSHVWLGYTESAGAPTLRAEIARLYSSITPDQVLVHSGAEEAIFTVMNGLLRPGDHVIVHTPCYQSLAEVPRSIGCEVSPWITCESDGWRLDLDTLRALLRPNTRLVVVNCPHNPTGYLMTPDDQRELVELLRQRGIVLFSDEVYRLLEYGAPTLPAACDLYEHAVSLGVMSKTFGLAGLRIGWIATRSADLLRPAVQFKDYLTICNSAPSEYLAEHALRQKDRLVARSLGIIRANRALLDAFFARRADQFQWVPPGAGPVAFPRLTLELPIDTFCARLVEAQSVMLVPGSQFDHVGNHFRLGFGRANLPEALARLEAFLDMLTW